MSSVGHCIKKLIKKKKVCLPKVLNRAFKYPGGEESKSLPHSAAVSIVFILQNSNLHVKKASTSYKCCLVYTGKQRKSSMAHMDADTTYPQKSS